jgi:dTDP-4-amino-4,6-dideoxygalactose transaminase
MKVDRAVERTIVPIADPHADIGSDREAILEAMRRVLDSGAYILGPEVKSFEDATARRLGVPDAVGVGSGTDALTIALLASGVGPGEEVITASHTAGPTIAAIHMAGAMPVLVEVEEESYCIDPAAIEAAIGPKTKAIIPIHLYGHPANLDRICAIASKHDIAVIEDCAQAHDASVSGRPVGSIGRAGCFSYYPTKNLGALGDGGLIAASTRKFAERVRQLRTYGWSTPQFSSIPNGRCSRLDELQAAVLNVKLASLSEKTRKRRAIAQVYNDAFKDLPLILPIEQPGCHHVYHLYVVRTDKRDALVRDLDKAGVATGRHYPFAAHVQPGIARGARIPNPLTRTELLMQTILTLPLFPSMRVDQVEKVISGVRSFFGSAQR